MSLAERQAQAVEIMQAWHGGGLPALYTLTDLEDALGHADDDARHGLYESAYERLRDAVEDWLMEQGRPLRLE